MRRYQKVEVLEFINSLYEVLEEIYNNLEKKDISLAQRLLADCQSYAVVLGESIEKIEKKDCITITYIEDFCELLYRTYSKISESVEKERALYENLKKQLIKIENSVKNDIPMKREIVFFPYKIAMWDSMESIYLEAKNDPTVDAYCVPIPYYEVNPDRTLGKIHYEGPEFLKYVEAIDYKNYRFEERKPDQIFIHNPFDDWNLVTTIEPRFYSCNLKQYTDQLVYIPYFVHPDIKVYDTASIEKMHHFCFLPGTVHADTVILQSEDIRKIYISEYTKAAQRRGMPVNLQMIEDKFKGWGSPKFDKVVSYDGHKEILGEWDKILIKEDGTRKKVIFYNISIAPLLTYEEKLLDKIERTLKIFKAYSSQVALIWRPHPLFISTLKSMKPQMLHRYLQIVATFKMEGWGIFDETPDMNLAISISDAYYGDENSSVVSVYEKTGKPMMLQTIEEVEPNWNLLNFSYELTIVQGYAYLSMEPFNAICKMDLTTGMLSFVDKNENERDMTPMLYRHALLDENKIYFSPTKAKSIAVLHLDQEKCSYIDLDLEEKIANRNKGMVKKYKRSLLFVGVCSTNQIALFDLEQERVTDYYNMNDPELSVTRNEMIFGFDCCILHDKLYIPIMKEGKFIIFDLETKEKRIKQISPKVNAVSMAINIGQLVYLITDSGDMYIYHDDTDELEVVEKLLDEEIYWRWHYEEGSLMLIPNKDGSEIVEIDIENLSVAGRKKIHGKIVDLVKYDEKKVTLYAEDSRLWYSELDKLEEKRQIQFDLCNSEKDIMKLCKVSLYDERVQKYKETQFLFRFHQLNSFLEWLIHRKGTAFTTKTGNIGKFIYSKLKGAEGFECIY